MNLSPLRPHKKHLNFAGTPSDICRCNQSMEDTRYFVVTVTALLRRNKLHCGR